MKSAADKAIQLDSNLAEAHVSLGWALYHEWDWAGAEKEFKRALELNQRLRARAPRRSMEIIWSRWAASRRGQALISGS